MRKPAYGPGCPYMGAKWRSAGYYPAPLYDTIVELFCGAGAGYSWMHGRRSLLYDSSPHVTAVWGALLSAVPGEIASLPAPIRTVEEVPEKWRALVGFWLNPGSSVPKRTASSRANPARLPYFPGSVWSAKTRDRLETEARLPQRWGWQFERRDWRTVPVPRMPVTFFIDPVYQEMGHHYPGGRWSQADYRDLGEFCLRLQGLGHQVIVCEGRSKKAAPTWLPFRALHRYHGSVRDSEELIWHSAV